MEKLKSKYSKNPLKTDIYNLNELKLVLDDVVQEFITDVRHSKQSKTSTDVKIVVGLISTVIASVVGYISVRFDFEAYKMVLTILIALYFTINFLVEVYLWCTGSSFVFSDKVVSTKINFPDPTYVMLVYNKNKLIPNKYTKSVFDLFDSDGRLMHEEFIDDLEKVFEK